MYVTSEMAELIWRHEQKKNVSVRKNADAERIKLLRVHIYTQDRRSLIHVRITLLVGEVVANGQRD